MGAAKVAGEGADLVVLDINADDYLVKPFEMDELKARIRALSQRKNLDYRARERIGGLEFDRNICEVSAGGGSLEIPRKELAVREAPSTQERNRHISELVSPARSSARVADQFLSLDRLQQTAMAAEVERIDIGRAVQDICAELGPSILSGGIEFAFNAPDAPIILTGDVFFLTEAIKHLIDNAVKHEGRR